MSPKSLFLSRSLRCSFISLFNDDCLVSGKHAIRVSISLRGRALKGADVAKQVQSRALLTNLSPTEGSVMCGTQITVTGNGFDPRPCRTTVQIGINVCTVTRVTSSEITCLTRKHNAGSFEVSNGTLVLNILRLTFYSYKPDHLA